jgi:hypothetical protein
MQNPCRQYVPLFVLGVDLGQHHRKESDMRIETSRTADEVRVQPMPTGTAVSTVAVPTVAVSTAALWTGRLLSGLVIVFLLLDGGMKLLPLPIVTETMAQLGYGSSESLARMLGVVTLGCTILYAIPQTSILGAILLTGYMGGAMATHLRVDDPLFSHTLFGFYLGLMAWGGLYLRDAALRGLIPLRRLSLHR